MAVHAVGEPGGLSVRFGCVACGSYGTDGGGSGNEPRIELAGECQCGTIADRPERADEQSRAAPQKCLGKSAYPRQRIAEPSDLTRVEKDDGTHAIRAPEIRILPDLADFQRVR